MTITKTLLFTYFAGRATPLQRQAIDAWLTDAANREQFYEWLEEWETRYPQYAASAETGLERFRQRLNDAPATETDTAHPLPGRARINWRWLAVAAVVVLVATAGYLGRNRWTYQTYATGYAQTRTLTLPDGSRVVLNAHSVLRVPRFGFGTSARAVRLTGEAEFDVRHTTDHRRFTVETEQGVQVEVLGTEFVVYARPRGTKVVLSRGKVNVHYAGGQTGQTLTMRPGDLVQFTAAGRLLRHQPTQPEQHTAWKHHRFVFDDTPLREVLPLLIDNYGLTVRLADPALGNRTLTGTFRAQTADELLQALSLALDVRIDSTDTGLLLTSPTD